MGGIYSQSESNVKKVFGKMGNIIKSTVKDGLLNEVQRKVRERSSGSPLYKKSSLSSLNPGLNQYKSKNVARINTTNNSRIISRNNAKRNPANNGNNLGSVSTRNHANNGNNLGSVSTRNPANNGNNLGSVSTRNPANNVNNPGSVSTNNLKGGSRKKSKK